MKLGSCLLCVNLVLPLFSQGSPQSALTQAKLQRSEIRFELYQEHLVVVHGSLGPLEHLNFLIDTGANPTAIDSAIAKKLRLGGESRKLALFNQTTPVEEVMLPSLRLGPIRTESFLAWVQDLSPVEKVLGVRIDAIVGFDVLSLKSFAIDYRSRKITFGPVDSAPLAVPFYSGPPSLTVQLKIQNQAVSLLVDTGAADLLLFKCKLTGRLRELPIRGGKASVNSAGSQFELQETLLPTVRLGVANFVPEKAFLVNDSQNCGRPFDGVLGVSALKLRQVAFDFEHRMFSWREY